MSNSVLIWKQKQCQVRLHVVTNSDQRSYIKTESLRGKNPAEIHNNLREVCGDNVGDRSTVSRWSARFCEDRLSTEDNPRSGRPSTTTDYTSEVIFNDILREDRREKHVRKLHMRPECLWLLFTESLLTT